MFNSRTSHLKGFRSGWYARDPGQATRLALSESHAPTSDLVRAAIAREADRLHLYPDSDTEPLRGDIARHWGVRPEQVVVTNGSDEALLLSVLATTQPGDRCVTTARTFAGYEAAFAIASLDVTLTGVTMRGIDSDQFVAALPGARLAVLCNPHNPTAACLADAEVVRIVQAAADAGTRLIIDEAYAEFADPGVLVRTWATPTRNDVIVLRTFSKAYGLAGLRCGYLLAGRATAEDISALRAVVPYNVNRLAVAGAAAALADQSWLAVNIRDVRAARAEIVESLAGHGIRCLPSQTNFVLADFGDRCTEIVNRLHDEFGIIIRDAEPMGFPGWARIGVCGLAFTDTLLHALWTTIGSEKARVAQ